MNIDLDAYFARIGYEGPRAPSLEALRAIHGLHAQHIPFENLNPLLGLPVRLDLESLQRKLVREGRGGYCFEQNLLLSNVLEELGFSVVGLAARVLWNAGEDAITPRTHMLLKVEVDRESYLADVGFGGLTLTAPLRLSVDEAQSTPHEPFRLMRRGSDFFMQAQVRGDWRTLYRFDLQEQFVADYEIANWYLSNHPQSRFVTSLIAGRPMPGRRYALLNTELSVHEPGGTQRRTLAGADELRSVLQDVFAIRLPGAPALNDALSRIAAGARS